ncbi:MAG: Kelch repeat-containing protein [Rhodanobacteraceae bacterium]
MLLLVATTAQAGGSFAQLDDMTSKRALQGAALLPDGKVLVVGGISDFGVFVATAELFDPATDTFSLTGSPIDARMRPTTVGLADGRVLVLGGLGGDGGSTYFTTAEIYDPATGKFTATGELSTRRYVASAALLEDGRVLVAAGFNRDDGPLLTAEVYDPATGKFTATGSLSTPRTEAKAVLRLADGRVMIAGGSNEDGPLASVELYDPVSGTFSTTGDLLQPLEGHSLAMLDDGKVLVVGGSDGGGSGFPVYYAQAELYDPASGIFTGTGSLAFPREFTTASRLPDGRILVAGGLHTDGSGPGYGVVGEAEIYDPATGLFVSAGDMIAALDEPVAVVLNDHRVLLVGGFDEIDDLPTATAEVFIPNVADEVFSNGFEPAARPLR